MIYARIAGTGSYLPAKILTNADLTDIVDTSDEWIYSRTGIRRRHVVAENEKTSYMAEKAARAALENAGLEPEALDLIVLATTTPDQFFPSTATMVQTRLGLKDIPAFDVQAVCSGFIYALDIAEKYIQTGAAQRVLVMGAESFTRLLDWSDRNTCVLFGDGAGAVILEASEKPGIYASLIHADGAYCDRLQVPGGIGNAHPELRFVEMYGRDVFRDAVVHMDEMVGEILAKANMQQSEIDWLVPHQANIRIISSIAKRLGLPMEKVILTLEDHGNTSAASVPLALDQGIRNNSIKRGDCVLLEAFGGGYTWGAALLRY